MKKLIIPIFIAIACVQWWVPASMIVKKEKILKDGKAYKFRTEPVDPSDPFKGRYISLRFEASNYTPKQKMSFSFDSEVFVILKNDAAGFAAVDSISTTRPTIDNFVMANVNYVEYDSPYTVMLRYPFDKFYMDEFKAPEAEALYRSALSDTARRTTYALVKVKSSEAVIEDVFVDGVPIRKLLK